MKKERFLGWYFKHQRDGETVAFIPGSAACGAFIQMIYGGGSRQFDVSNLTVRDGAIRAGNCVFSERGVKIDLPDVRGEIRYGPLTRLKTDIMGPFRHLPMECRHGVISMGHALEGSVIIDGQTISFDGGTGYIECDGGTSFPRSYQWVQCNVFPEPCSVIASIAEIPFLGLRFTGCICAIVYQGKEYRIATYRGARIRAATPEHIRLSQGRLLLEVDITSRAPGHPLKSPVRGRMTGIIRESNCASARFRLWEGGRQVFDLTGENVGYEYVR